MNIKITAFTVTEKYINTKLLFLPLTDHHEQSAVTLYNNFSSLSQPGVLVYSNNSTKSKKFKVHKDPPILLRVLGITNVDHPLTICEVKLTEDGNV